MKKKNYYPIIIIIICIFLCFFAFFIFKNSKNEPSNSNTLTNTSNVEIQNFNIVSDEKIKNVIDEKVKEPVETELSSFTTDLSFSSEGRLKNIEITSQKLNGTIVEPHAEFSFNNTTRSISCRRRL